MRIVKHHLNRRTFLRSAVIAATAGSIAKLAPGQEQSNTAIPLFDGASLNGWIDSENSATSFSSSDVTDLTALAKKLTDKSDPVSVFVNSQLDDTVKAQLAALSSPNAAPDGAAALDPKAATSALVKNLEKIISGPSIYEQRRFRDVNLRPETQSLLSHNAQGAPLVHLNKLLFQDAFPAELAKDPSVGWIVKEGAIASTGAGRGILYTARDFGRFRLRFAMRHVSGNPDHQACVLIFCTRPQSNEIPLDALGGIQFQVPKGGHWDYRPGQNVAGADFTTLVKPQFDPQQWSRVEILADASTGSARMAVAQPVDSTPIEILDFRNQAAGKVGPVALQMHNAGLFDEYKDLSVEINPASTDL